MFDVNNIIFCISASGLLLAVWIQKYFYTIKVMIQFVFFLLSVRINNNLGIFTRIFFLKSTENLKFSA